jgi:Druantia protein DruA
MEELLVQGRALKGEELDGIRQLIIAHPQWGRCRLSVHLAQQWNWRNGVGQLKDMATRSLLLKLERRGLLLLPPRQRSGGGNRKACKCPGELGRLTGWFSAVALHSALAEVLPLQVVQVENPAQRQLFGRLLQHHHYLGYCRPVGENLPYLVQTRCGQLMGCALFGAAAWKCAPRDNFIGWSDPARQTHLPWVANNMRLLLLPGVQVPQLSSHLLAALIQRVSSDWQRKYGHPIFLLETFVEPERFAGTSYRAANWVYVGQTQGRGRQGPSRHLRSTSLKDVYLFPLHPRFRQHLRGAGHAPEEP